MNAVRYYYYSHCSETITARGGILINGVNHKLVIKSASDDSSPALSTYLFEVNKQKNQKQNINSETP